MNIRFSNQKQKICEKHNSSIVRCSTDPKIGECCHYCLQELSKKLNLKQNDKEQQKIQNFVAQVIDQNAQIFYQLLDELWNLRQNVIININQIAHNINFQLNYLNECKNYFNDCIQSDNDLISVNNNCQSFNNQVREQIGKQFKSFQNKFCNINNRVAQLSRNQERIKENIQNPLNNVSMASKNIRYQLTQYQKISLRTDEELNAFTFHKNIFAYSNRTKIHIYEFIDGRIVRLLKAVETYGRRSIDSSFKVYDIQFLKKSNGFFAKSIGVIQYWNQDEYNNWELQLNLESDQDLGKRILINKNEDLLISTRIDKTIRFFRLIEGVWTYSQALSTKYCVIKSSLNEEGNKLITYQGSGVVLHECFQSQEYYDKNTCIQVIVLQQNLEWHIVQTISLPKKEWELCFILGEYYIFSCFYNDIEIFEYDQDSDQFQQVSEVKIKNSGDWFAFENCQFIRHLNIFAIQISYRKFFIYTINEDNNFKVIQKLSGIAKISDDGQNLIQWEKKYRDEDSSNENDQESRQLQIREIFYQG